MSSPHPSQASILPQARTGTEQWCELDGKVLHLHAAWRLANAGRIWQQLSALALPSPLRIQGSSLDALDTAGASLLLRALRATGIAEENLQWDGFTEKHLRILAGVRRCIDGSNPPVHEPGATGVARVLAPLGRRCDEVLQLLGGHLNFLGAALVACFALLRRPAMLRVKELTVQFEQVCLHALPVVALVTMLIGVTVTYLLGLQAEKYGANIFVVDGVGIGMTREFSPIIVATIIAGRSGAAFTAQLGAMRLTEEIDAIRTLGLSPMQLLVLPRVLALVLGLPLLVFVGSVMGIAGAMLVSEPLLGLTPSTVINRLHTALPLTHVWVGLAKAPVFALFIGIIGCRMGMTVARDTRAVGLATTSTVVQSIVCVILLDAAFAIVLQALGL